MWALLPALLWLHSFVGSVMGPRSPLFPPGRKQPLHLTLKAKKDSRELYFLEHNFFQVVSSYMAAWLDATIHSQGIGPCGIFNGYTMLVSTIQAVVSHKAKKKQDARIIRPMQSPQWVIYKDGRSKILKCCSSAAITAIT